MTKCSAEFLESIDGHSLKLSTGKVHNIHIGPTGNIHCFTTTCSSNIFVHMITVHRKFNPYLWGRLRQLHPEFLV